MKGTTAMKKKIPYALGVRLIPIWPIIMMVFCFCTVFWTPEHALGSETAVAVWGDFSNTLKVPPGVNPDVTKSTSATFFGGHIKVSPNASGVMQEPQGGGYKLAESSFGQAVANTIPFLGFEQKAVDDSLGMLYYEYSGDSAAFRYKVYLYSSDASYSISKPYQTMEDYWNEDARGQAVAAAQLIRNALKYNPYHAGLRNALLDIYYDTAVADLTMATNKMVEAQKAALGLPGYIPPPREFLISNEIEQVEEALPKYDAAIKPYFDLLKDDLGVDMARVDGSVAAANMPFGYYIFQKDVPGRSLYAPSYKDQNGTLQQVVDTTVLFTGYKDLVLLFGIERDAARAAAKLAKLYALRGKPGDSGSLSDADLAREVIGEAQQKSYTDGSILNGIFTVDQLAQADPPSGLVEARASWAQGLSALSGIKSFLDGNANPLGLDKGFLALVQPDLVPGTCQGSNDSYDCFANLLLPGGQNPGGPLGDAKAKYDLAFAQYEKVRLNSDALQAELEKQRGEFGTRLHEIVGVEFSIVPPPKAEYSTPEKNVGSDIYIQRQNIDLASLCIKHNQQEIDNLNMQIQIETDRRGQEKGINDLIGQTYIKYGDKQARLTEEIAAINALQAFCNENAKGADNWLTSLGISAGAHTVNAIVQAAEEVGKGYLEAQKQHNAAQEQAEIHYLNDQISAVESEARVKDLWLGMNTLVIESLEAVLTLA